LGLDDTMKSCNESDPGAGFHQHGSSRVKPTVAASLRMAGGVVPASEPDRPHRAAVLFSKSAGCLASRARC